MTTSARHRLIGLEPDNLLAFMALLGLLRVLDIARPAWRLRCYWGTERPPNRPVLITASETDEAAVCLAAAEGCDQLAGAYDFGGRKSADWPAGDFRKLAIAAARAARPKNRVAADIIAALASDWVTDENKDATKPTPFCAMFGQGHQYFLHRLSRVPAESNAPARGRGRKAKSPTPVETMQEALFAPWSRIDPSDGFRWDYAEDRRYALRAGNPSKETILTVHGANRLATIGLSLLTVAPGYVGGHRRLHAVSVSHTDSGETVVSWPIWSVPLGMTAIRALLVHPGLDAGSDQAERLGPLGVSEIRRCRRYSVGKYVSFSRAEPIMITRR